VRLRALVARHSARLISNRPIVTTSEMEKLSELDDHLHQSKVQWSTYTYVRDRKNYHHLYLSDILFHLTTPVTMQQLYQSRKLLFLSVFGFIR
jgi:hypothetical protein